MIGSVLAFVAGAAVGAGISYSRWLRHRAEQGALRLRSRLLYELADGDLEQVGDDLEQACERETADPSLFLALAAIDRERQRVGRAKSIHRTVLASEDLPSEQRVAALLGLGRDLLREGNHRAAVGALVRANSLSPRSVATLRSLAKALEQAGAWERAAAAWERVERQVQGRAARDAKVGRGHALAEQAEAFQRAGDEKRARKTAERATTLAPDSAHAWTMRARVEATMGDPHEAMIAWQRAWELGPAQAGDIVEEAWRWAERQGRQADVMARMLASSRDTTDPSLAIALAERVALRHPEQAAASLEQVSATSSFAQLALIRLRLRRGQRDQAREAALRAVAEARLVCGRCRDDLAKTPFRCERCQLWDTGVREA